VGVWDLDKEKVENDENHDSDEEGGDDGESDGSEDETREMLGSPSPSEEEEPVISRLSREGGVSFLSFLVSKAVPVREEKEQKEWTYKDMIGLPAGELEEWRAACQRENRNPHQATCL